ncbi:MAG: DNA/RNA non-specific endonuclease [Bacteroidetes bacterium]|nr:DNA/RNA non-specific endonuclease [Bacteroidota bacterium]
MRAQTLLAGWDFQTTSNGGTAITVSPNTPTLLQANFGTGHLYLNGNFGSSNWISANQLNAFGGTTMNAGTGFSTSISGAASLALVNQSANGQAIVFAFSMSGYANLQVSYATQRSGTGYTSQQWLVSSDAINWTPIQTINSIGSSFSVQSLNPITALNQISTAYVKVIFTGATGVSGNNRIDNIQLNATPSIMPPMVINEFDTATVGIPYSYFINANHTPTSYSASNLASGLLVNSLSGEISGIPDSAVSNLPIQIFASNSGGTGNATLMLTIEKGTQQIVFDTLPSKTFGDSNFNVIATGGNSGNPIIFTSDDTSIATISGNQLQIHGAGTCYITATQAGNVNYHAAIPISRNFTVHKAVQTIQFISPGNKLATDSAFNLQASGGASGNPIQFISSDTNTLIISGTVASIVGSGNVQITASQSGNQNYEAANSVSHSITINKVSQVISFNSIIPKLVGAADFTLHASGGASGNAILFTSSDPSIASVNGNLVSIHNSGIVFITASQAGNFYYEAANNVSQVLIINSSSTDIQYTFGTAILPTSLPTSGTPIAHLNISAISQGNNANINQGTINLTATSSSNNPGSSGEMNAGITARNRNLQLDSSAYFEFTIQPDSAYVFTLHTLQFNSRSTGTGPTNLELRSSEDNYASVKASMNVLANSSWSQIISPLAASYSFTTRTYRLYGFVNGGSGSINTGSNPNNWRIDDILLNISVQASTSCNTNVTATAGIINCHGGVTDIVVHALNTNGSIQYQLHNNLAQSDSIFTNQVAGLYTITVTDAFTCSASTLLLITEPATTLVTASGVSACAGQAVTLYGNPVGGIYSLPNPYVGVSNSYTYSYTDSVGCTTVSAPAAITINPCATLQLNCFIQSYYIGNEMMSPCLFLQGASNDSTLVDDITIELRDPNTFSLISTGYTQLHTNGTASISFPNVSGYFYIVIKHRNALQTWSALPVLLQAGITQYNFSNSASKAFGNNLIEVDSSIWALFSGDVNVDENLDLLDLSEVETEVENFNFGYTHCDLNGDGNVDLLDLPTLENNVANFISSMHPVYIIFPETMESGTKTFYSSSTISLSTGSWNLDDALIGTSSSDKKNGTKSVRMQNVGKLTMLFDVYIDSSYLTIYHAKYGSDSASSWALFSSIDGGANWQQVGGQVISNLNNLQSTVFQVQYTGNIRFQIRKLSGGKLNIDDFNITQTQPILFPDNDPLSLGNPSNAATDISMPDNYLLTKTQYVLAYNNSKGLADWVIWHLDINDLGSTPRCDCFAMDAQLPSTFYRAGASSYSGSGFDRGHQLPSSQRNNNITNNAATFLMSNMMPQSPNLNQITWNNMEAYCTNLANAGYELYTYSGGYGSGGTGSNGGITYTIAGGNIQVPSHYWKIVVVLPAGSNDANRVDTNTRVIAVSMPNTQTVNSMSWGNYRTSIDAIESSTGFDFLSALPVSLQNTIEGLIDSGPTN